MVRRSRSSLRSLRSLSILIPLLPTRVPRWCWIRTRTARLLDTMTCTLFNFLLQVIGKWTHEDRVPRWSGMTHHLHRRYRPIRCMLLMILLSKRMIPSTAGTVGTAHPTSFILVLLRTMRWVLPEVPERTGWMMDWGTNSTAPTTKLDQRISWLPTRRCSCPIHRNT